MARSDSYCMQQLSRALLDQPIKYLKETEYIVCSEVRIFIVLQNEARTLSKDKPLPTNS